MMAVYENRYTRQRQRMVESQIRSRGIKDPKVLRALMDIPRHRFIEEALWEKAYGDYPLPIGENQTISQPYTVAVMTEALKLTGDEKVLELGTGSGYQTAVLTKLCEKVYSIERIASLAKKARRNLDAIGIYNVEIRVGDGTRGWSHQAPFDAILVAAGSPDVPQTLLKQLADKGRMVIPTGDSNTQTMKRITKKGDDYDEKNLGEFRFVDLIGEYGWKR